MSARLSRDAMGIQSEVSFPYVGLIRVAEHDAPPLVPTWMHSCRPTFLRVVDCVQTHGCPRGVLLPSRVGVFVLRAYDSGL